MHTCRRLFLTALSEIVSTPERNNTGRGQQHHDSGDWKLRVIGSKYSECCGKRDNCQELSVQYLWPLISMFPRRFRALFLLVGMYSHAQYSWNIFLCKPIEKLCESVIGVVSVIFNHKTHSNRTLTCTRYRTFDCDCTWILLVLFLSYCYGSFPGIRYKHDSHWCGCREVPLSCGWRTFHLPEIDPRK